MNGIKYAQWASHYDPDNKEIQCLRTHGIDFKNKKVLEVGSGTGRFTKRIVNDCSEITCIDPDDNALDILRSTISSSKVSIICGTLESSSLDIKHYDYVIFPWSMYLIPNQEEVIRLSREHLKKGGSIAILQAQAGEYEEEISKLYRNYNSLEDYKKTYDTIASKVKKKFGNVTTDILTTYFEFDDIDQVIDCSLFFIEDAEGKPPRHSDVEMLRKLLVKYVTPKGSIIMSDIVSVTIAKKE